MEITAGREIRNLLLVHGLLLFFELASSSDANSVQPQKINIVED